VDDLVPLERRIDRQTLDRVIRRAAELQASEREIGDSLTEQQLLELGRDVGIPARHLHQALQEEQLRLDTDTRGALARFMGPSRLSAGRTVPGEDRELEDKLARWMNDAELLTVKRRYADRMSWEPRRDFAASLKRELGIGGRKYALARAKEIVGHVRQLESGCSYVTLRADVSNTRTGHLVGASIFAGSGVVLASIAGLLGIFLPVAVIPAAIGVIGGLGIVRSRRGRLETTQVALEQVLDRIEHGELDTRQIGPGSPQGTIQRIVTEIRKNLGA
jgi:hypothetical protein